MQTCIIFSIEAIISGDWG